MIRKNEVPSGVKSLVRGIETKAIACDTLHRLTTALMAPHLYLESGKKGLCLPGERRDVWGKRERVRWGKEEKSGEKMCFRLGSKERGGESSDMK